MKTACNSIRTRRLVLICSSVIAGLMLSSCSLLPKGYEVVPNAAAGADDTNIAENLKPFYTQQLTWEDCGPVDCATVKAPLDWDQPELGSIDIAINKSAALEPKKRLGTLFLNPGGPGGSGISMIAMGAAGAVSPDVTLSYDVIGFDPRGVGQSTSVKCFGTPADQNEFIYDTDTLDIPYNKGTAEYIELSKAKTAKFAGDCANLTGELINHTDTVSTAKDLDLLRAVMKDTHLNYIGFSYGTFLGATYAELFPKHVGRMVLDGAIDPSITGKEMAIAQTAGFEKALRQFAAFDATNKISPTRGPSVKQGEYASDSGEIDASMKKIASILDQLEKTPLVGTDSRVVDGDVLSMAIASYLYSKMSWMLLTQVFADVQAGKADSTLAGADAYFGRNEDGTYASNITEANNAINCLDYVWPTTEELHGQLPEYEAVAPTVGKYMLSDSNCNSWPAKTERTPHKVEAKGSSDILVIGTVNDPATPYKWSVALAEQLSKGHLITYQGEGHTVYNHGGNACIDSTVDKFLISGIVPEKDPNCSIE